MRKPFSTTASLGLVLAVASFAFASVPITAHAQQPRKVASVEGITEYQFDNGLRLLLFPDPTRPRVTVNLTLFVGSRHEGYGEAGMAHLLEHMLFKGTTTHPNIPGLMKEVGANFNGSTWVDRTNYYETLPAGDQNLEVAIKLEADRLINCPIRPEDLATEFSVVRNEFESGENSPQRVLSQRMQAVAYEWHNYGKSTIGNRADIERVPVDNLRAFYKKYYQPDNAMLVVAGNFKPEKALELVQKYFGPIPKPSRELPRTYTEEPAQDGERGVILRRVGDVGIVAALYHVPAASHPEFPAVQVLASILADEPSGRLYRALVETKKATNTRAGAFAFKDPGLLQMSATVNSKDRATLESVRQLLIDTAESVAKTGVTSEEVSRARTQQLKESELAMTDPNRLAIELSEWAAQGDWRLFFLNRDNMEKVTPEQVKEVAAKYLASSNRTVGMFIPSAAPERTEIPAAPEIAALVKDYKGREDKSSGELLDTNPIALEARVQRPQPIEGVKIALLPKKTRGELVRISLQLHYGNETNLKGLVDAANFLGPLMSRGTKSLNRQQIQDALDQNLAEISVGGGGGGGRGGRGMGGGGSLGTLNVSVQTKRSNLPVVIDLLRQILREPSFPENEFTTMKTQRLAMIEQFRSEPMFLGASKLGRLMSKYPADDVRYAPTLEESIERLKAVTLEQVVKLHRDFLGASHGELAAVGDFDSSELLALLRPVLEGWKSGEAYQRIERPFQGGLEAVREVVLTPDKANAMYLGALAVKMSDADPDYPALVLGNFMLGGGSISSRIADRLRQKDGLSYGAGSSFSAPALDDSGRLMINAIYNPLNESKVIRGVDEELARFVREGVTADELDKARNGLLRQRETGRSSDAALAGMLSSQLEENRTMKFEAEIDARMKSLTVEAVNEAIRKYLDPAKLIVVTAGDFKKVEKTPAKP